MASILSGHHGKSKWTPSLRNPRHHANVTPPLQSILPVEHSEARGLTVITAQVGRPEPRVSMKMPTLYNPRVVLPAFSLISLHFNLLLPISIDLVEVDLCLTSKA
jgi:hypothetical protein